MILYPAVDLKDGKCVRLLRGDMEKATVYGDDPASQASHFEEYGFKWLHLVDLNGAFQGKPVNGSAVKAILNRVKMPVQLGGGIRNIDTLAMWLEAGVSRVILGTAALKNPLLVKEACRQFPGQVAVGIDAQGGKAAVAGWAEVSDVSAVDLALRFEDAGVAAIIYTDISRDGAMEGPNINETVRLAERLTTPVILSGGITTIEDVQKVTAAGDSGIEGMIIGKALYTGTIDIRALLNMVEQA